jgi:hypothetical protein
MQKIAAAKRPKLRANVKGEKTNERYRNHDTNRKRKRGSVKKTREQRN